MDALYEATLNQNAVLPRDLRNPIGLSVPMVRTSLP